MSCSITSLKICLAGFVGILLTASVGQAITLGGDPSVAGDTATISNVDGFAPVEITDSQEVFDIVLRDMQHLQIFDVDSFEVQVGLVLQNPPPPTNPDANVTISMFFSDEDGRPVGPGIPDINIDLAAGPPLTSIGTPVPVATPTDFVMHDFHINVSVEGTVRISAINVVDLIGVSPNSNVGVWAADQAVPEPMTAALSLMGLGVLGMATRRRTA